MAHQLRAINFNMVDDFTHDFNLIVYLNAFAFYFIPGMK